jgi:hypothetical protein
VILVPVENENLSLLPGGNVSAPTPAIVEVEKNGSYQTGWNQVDFPR